MASTPKLIFIRVDIGDHLVLGLVEFRCGKSRSSFEKSRLLVSVRGCLDADAPSSSFIVSLSGVVWPSRVDGPPAP